MLPVMKTTNSRFGAKGESVMKLRGEKGFSLVLTLLILILASVFIVAIQNVSRNNINVANNRDMSQAALNIAESGLTSVFIQKYQNMIDRNITEFDTNWVDYDGGRYRAAIYDLNPQTGSSKTTPFWVIVSTGERNGIQRTIIRNVSVKASGAGLSGEASLYTWGSITLNGPAQGSFWTAKSNAHINGAPLGTLVVMTQDKFTGNNNQKGKVTIVENVPPPGNGVITYNYSNAKKQAQAAGTYYSNAGQNPVNNKPGQYILANAKDGKIFYFGGDLNLDVHMNFNFEGEITIVCDGNINVNNGFKTTKGRVNLVARGNIIIDRNADISGAEGLWYSDGTLIFNDGCDASNFKGKLVTKGDVYLNQTTRFPLSSTSVTVDDENFSGLPPGYTSFSNSKWQENRESNVTALTRVRLTQMFESELNELKNQNQ